MDAAAAKPTVKFNRWLPYWAVLQADVHQTLRGWLYRSWVLATMLATAGYLLFRMGEQHHFGLILPVSTFLSDLLYWTALGSVALIVVLTAGSISAERGTMADSVLSRGISRYQYFLGKWHARLLTILGTYTTLAVIAMICGLSFLHEDLSWGGCVAALLTVAVLLGTLVSVGVAVSAVANTTLSAVAV